MKTIDLSKIEVLSHEEAYSVVLEDMARLVAEQEFESINKDLIEAGKEPWSSRSALIADIIWGCSIYHAGPDPDDSE